MALFPDDRGAVRPRSRGRRIGLTLIILVILGTLGFTFVPAPYVIEEPGPVFNTIGTVQIGAKTVPLIDIPAKTTYPTAGTLDMLTVDLLGSPDGSPSWLQVAQAWLDPSKALVPMDSVYPPGTTVQQSNEESETEMADSQQDAVAAALSHLGYPIVATLKAGQVLKGSPAAGKLTGSDVIVSANGTKVDSLESLHKLIVKNGASKPVQLEIRRGGVESTVAITPKLSTGADPAPYIGIVPTNIYTFPFQVKIQLENVGGPSAGQMLALGIIDKLTPGKLNGGANVAGTGTIDKAGTIGAIGGIRQKMYGALGKGAKYFLAPASNCDEVVGHVPNGLTVFAVKTLDDSLKALSAIKAGSGTASLPTCTAK